MYLTTEQVKNRIREIGNEIETELMRVVGYEDASTGRKGKRCFLSTGKKGITLGVVGFNRAYNGYHFMIAFETGNAVLAGMEGSVADRLRNAVLMLRARSEDEHFDDWLDENDPKFRQSNPKVCSYTLDNFKKLWELLLEEDLGLEDSEPRGKKLFPSNEFDAKKIVARYRYAIQQEDQVLLDLGRRLLEADDWDHFISINMKEEGYAEREHIVPCYMIHWRIIDLLYPENYETRQRELRDDRVDGEIARMIERNLKIVHISKSQRSELDIALGWKITMPEGWDWDESPYARLIAGGVPVRNAHVRGLEDEEWNENRLILIDDAAGAGE